MANQNHPARPRREVVLADAGGWISGPSMDVPLSTLQKRDLALSVPCPVHDVAPGEVCPAGSLDGACMARRTAALGDA
jgi:hypothetical protein